MSKKSNTTGTRVYSKASSAKGRVTSRNKEAGYKAYEVKAVEGGYVVSEIVIVQEKSSSSARQIGKFVWLPSLIQRLHAEGCTSSNLQQSQTPKRIRLTLDGHTVAWFTKQEYVDATLAAL